MNRGIFILCTWNLLLVIGGYFIPVINNKAASRLLTWTIVVATIIGSVTLTSHASPIARMIFIVIPLLVALKVVVLNEVYDGKPRLTFMQWCLFSLAWFGMRPSLFEAFPAKSLDARRLLATGFLAFGGGIILLHISVAWEFTILNVLSGPLTLIGLSLVLHFGILNLSTACWRLVGVGVKELFRAPHKSNSLKDFWGKRWNVAFSEMTALIVYKPVKEKGRKLTALIAAFLLSGLLHEVAISFPVQTAYGLPLSYFVIHGVLMIAEERMAIVKRILAHRIWAHVWTLSWIIIPLPLLFPSSFFERVLEPLRNELVFAF